MNAYFLLGIALVLNAAANLLMKLAALRSAPAAPGSGLPGVVQVYLTVPFVAGLACFGLNVLAYTQALKRLPISIAYPTMVSLGYLIILVVSWFVFQERLTLPRYLGAGLMLAGLWLLVR
jgi:multidrug transporter EmrE-like cation transporter